MQDEELKQLRKSVRKAKRIVGEKAALLHDLVEERLPQDYEDIPVLSQDCYHACTQWAELNHELMQAESEISEN